MFKKIILSSLILLPILILVDQAAFTFSGTPPNSRTGAPGENSCTSGCHDSFSENSGNGILEIVVGSGVDHYKPDSTYAITVSITQAGALIYGFQSTVLNQDGIFAGTFFNISGQSTGISNSTINGSKRFYIGHRNASSKNSWKFNWKAPKGNAGPLELFASANAGNGDGGSSGDFIYTSSIPLKQDSIPLGINASTFNNKIKLEIYPNPSSQYINVRAEKEIIYQADLYSTKGEHIKVDFEKNSIDLKKLSIPSGIYFLKFSTSNGFMVKKFIYQE